MFRRLLKNEYFFSMLNKFSSIFFGVATAAFLNRYLGLEARGQYAKIMSVVTVAALILDLGIYQAFPYFKRKYGEEALNKFMALTVLQAIVYFVLAVAGCFIVKNAAIGLSLFIIPTCVLIQQFGNLVLATDVVYRSIANIVAMTFCLIATFILFLFRNTYQSLFAALFVFFLRSVAFVALYYVKLPHKISFKNMDFRFFGQVLKYSFFPMLTKLLSDINTKVDIWFLTAYKISNAQIGLFSVSLSIIEYMAYIPGTVNDVLYNHSAKKNTVSEVLTSIKIISVIIAAVSVVVIIFAKPVLIILYGKEFEDAYNFVLIFLISRIGDVVFLLIRTLFLADNKRIRLFAVMAGEFAVNCILNFALVGSFGAYGSAVATVCSEVIAAVVLMWMFKTEYSIPVKSLFTFSDYEIQLFKNKINQLFNKIRKIKTN